MGIMALGQDLGFDVHKAGSMRQCKGLLEQLAFLAQQVRSVLEVGQPVVQAQGSVQGGSEAHRAAMVPGTLHPSRGRNTSRSPRRAGK